MNEMEKFKREAKENGVNLGDALEVGKFMFERTECECEEIITNGDLTELLREMLPKKMAFLVYVGVLHEETGLDITDMNEKELEENKKIIETFGCSKASYKMWLFNTIALFDLLDIQ